MHQVHVLLTTITCSRTDISCAVLDPTFKPVLEPEAGISRYSFPIIRARARTRTRTSSTSNCGAVQDSVPVPRDCITVPKPEQELTPKTEAGPVSEPDTVSFSFTKLNKQHYTVAIRGLGIIIHVRAFLF